MATIKKALQRLLSVPKDFTWDEMIKVLGLLGFVELKKGKTGGARRKFSDGVKNVIILHKPHPGNIVKEYALRQVIAQLKDKGYINDE